MNEFLQFVAKAQERFDKDEIYSFLAGLTVGFSYFVFHQNDVTNVIGKIEFSNPLFYIAIVLIWIFATASTYVFSQILFLSGCWFFRWKAKNIKWELEAKKYKESESSVRHISNFSQLLLLIHLFSLLASAFLLLTPLAWKIGSDLNLCAWWLAFGFIVAFFLSYLICFRGILLWLRLEKLYLHKAFKLVHDLNKFLEDYGVHKMPDNNQEDAVFESTSPTTSPIDRNNQEQ